MPRKLKKVLANLEPLTDAFNQAEINHNDNDSVRSQESGISLSEGTMKMTKCSFITKALNARGSMKISPMSSYSLMHSLKLSHTTMATPRIIVRIQASRALRGTMKMARYSLIVKDLIAQRLMRTSPISSFFLIHSLKLNLITMTTSLFMAKAWTARGLMAISAIST